MKVSIRKSKNQKEPLSTSQLDFATQCILRYMKGDLSTYHGYEGSVALEKMNCDVYKTKTQISAIVYFQKESI